MGFLDNIGAIGGAVAVGKTIADQINKNKKTTPAIPANPSRSSGNSSVVQPPSNNSGVTKGDVGNDNSLIGKSPTGGEDFYTGPSAVENPAYTPVAPAETTTITDTTDISRQIESLKRAQLASKIAGLDKSYQASTANLDTEQAAIAPQYQTQRNAAAAQSDIGAMNFAQYMASRGVKGASAGMPEIYRNNALQGQIGALNQQEQSANDTIGRNRTQLGNAYQSDITAANNDVESQALQAQIEQMNADRTYQAQQDAAALEKDKYANTLTQQNRQEYESNAGQYASDYQAQINAIKNDGDTSNDWQADILANLRQQKLASQQAAQKAAEEKAASAKTESEKEAIKNALDIWKTSGTANSYVSSVLGVPSGAMTADYNMDSIQAKVSQQNADTSAKNADTSRINANKVSATEPKYKYKEDPDFAIDISWIASNKESAYDEISSKAESLIKKYGYDGYAELLKQASTY